MSPVAEDLELKAQRVANVSRRQATCAHRNGWAFVANRVGNGELQFWKRCNECGGNVTGPGKWIPRAYFENKGYDVTQFPVIDDRTSSRPPCRVCGARGSELHHWAPRALFGDEADVWPTDFLCRRCHTRWHTAIANAPLQLVLDGVTPLPRTSEATGGVPRRTAVRPERDRRASAG
jgi:hypothetical protein